MLDILPLDHLVVVARGPAGPSVFRTMLNEVWGSELTDWGLLVRQSSISTEGGAHSNVWGPVWKKILFLFILVCEEVL